MRQRIYVYRRRIFCARRRHTTGREFNCKLVEVTGGEPLAQREAFTLIERLCAEGFEVLVETGGFVSTAEVDPRAKIFWTLSVRHLVKQSRNHWPNLERLRADKDEVKFVIANFEDWHLRVGNYWPVPIGPNVRKPFLISPAWNAVI